MKSTSPCTTVFTATIAFSSCSHVGDAASKIIKSRFVIVNNFKGIIDNRTFSKTSRSRVQLRESWRRFYDSTTLIGILKSVTKIIILYHLLCCDINDVKRFKKIKQNNFVCLPGFGSMFARSSKWGLSLFKFAGSPVRCKTIVNSCTLFAKDSGDWSWK